MSTMPTVLHCGVSRGAIELKQFFREKEAVIFTVSLPAVLLMMLGSISDDVMGGVRVSQMLAASIAAAGIVSTSFAAMGTALAAERDDGTLKRLRAMPVPPAAFFLGKVVMVLVASLAELVLLLTIGVLMFDLPLPTDPVKWLTLAWLFVLGVTGCTFLGIAASSLARSARAAGAVVTMPFLVMQFISGVYIVPTSEIPTPLREIGAFFPLKWLAQGFRSVFLPDGASEHEIAGSWELDRAAIVLAAWCVAGLVLCVTTFRWRGKLTR